MERGFRNATCYVACQVRDLRAPPQVWQSDTAGKFMRSTARILIWIGWLGFSAGLARSATDVYLTAAPDYTWYAGCFGTACGNLMGFWDRHGFPDFYNGPTAGGVAPLDDFGLNVGIRSMWASKAGFDGRPAGLPGHIDDYWGSYDNDVTFSYESTDPDPYQLLGRSEHAPDCIGDFIGLSQKKWINLNGECDGNIDAYSFVYWDRSGDKRVNFAPGPEAGLPATDIQSGLRAWTKYRGYDSDVFTQLTAFNPHVPVGKGFTFADLRAEIEAGYPVLLFLQDNFEFSRPLADMPKANPRIHGMLAYGYYIADSGTQYVRCRTSWGSGDNKFYPWTPEAWVEANMPVRGVIGYHPLPKITSVSLDRGNLTLRWDAPAAQLRVRNATEIATKPAHAYVVEKAVAPNATAFAPVSPVITDREVTLADLPDRAAFFRVKVVSPQ